MIDVADVDRDALGGDPSGESLADRDPYPLLDLLLDSPRGTRDELVGVAVEQQDRDGVDVECVSHPVEQLVEQFLEPQLRERGIAELVEHPQLLARRQDRLAWRQHGLAYAKPWSSRFPAFLVHWHWCARSRGLWIPTATDSYAGAGGSDRRAGGARS